MNALAHMEHMAHETPTGIAILRSGEKKKEISLQATCAKRAMCATAPTLVSSSRARSVRTPKPARRPTIGPPVNSQRREAGK